MFGMSPRRAYRLKKRTYGAGKRVVKYSPRPSYPVIRTTRHERIVIHPTPLWKRLLREAYKPGTF